MNHSISGLIIEGVCGSGKTTILKKLTESPRFQNKSGQSTIVLSEHHTQRVLEKKERTAGLRRADNLNLLDEHATYLENMNERLARMPWAENGRSNMRLAYIFERFHLTHVSHYEHMQWEDVQDIDNRLARLNCKAILLIVDRHELQQRVEIGRDSGWREYLTRFGETDSEITDHYLGQQCVLQKLCERSKLEILMISTSEVDAETTTARILDHWGNMWAK